MKAEIIISIVGCFGTIALTINAFFLRGIFLDLNDVKVKLAAIVENSKGKEKRLEELEENQKDIYNRLNKLEREVRI